MQEYKNEKKQGMVRQEKDGVTFLAFPAFLERRELAHLFSTRLGGVSEDCFSTMNLSFTRGDDPDRVMENYRRMAGVLECRRCAGKGLPRCRRADYKGKGTGACNFLCRLCAAVFL
mgnify:CR=1 FL=1